MARVPGVAQPTSAEQAAAAVLGALPHAVLLLDAEGHIRFANGVAGTLLGPPAEELFGRPLSAWVEVEYRPALARAVERVHAGVPVSRLELPLQRHAGTEHTWVEWEGTPSTEGALFLGRDVRMRRAVRAALADQHAELRETLAGVLDTVPVGIVISDASGGPRLVNRAARDLLGIHALAPIEHWCRAGVLRRPNGSSATADDVPALRTLQDGAPRRDIELHVVRPWGEAVPVLLNTDAVHDDQGNIIEVCCTFTDIRERRRIERQLHQSQKMEAVGTLAGGIAHDFNNILCAIQGYSELALTQATMDERGSKMLREILKASERASKLTRQLLAFSRGEVLAPQRVDLTQLVGDMESMLRRLLGEHVVFETYLLADACPVTADPGQLEQVLLNLVLNAADAMPEGGRVRLGLERILVPGVGSHGGLALLPGEYVVLSVEDGGCGMDEKTLAQVFEPFFSTKERGKGTGLGLSTVYGIVKQNRGRIHVESGVGTGTAFRVYLPIVEEPLTEAPVEALPPTASKGGAHILLVEDEELVRSLIREILEEEGHTVHEARNGVEALELAASVKAHVHLLVTDVIMPRLGGRELAARLRRTRPDLRVLFVSGHADEALACAATAHGATAYLPKPFDAETLTARVRSMLDAV